MRALREKERHSQSLLRLSKQLELAQSWTQIISAARDEVRATIGYANVWVYLLRDDGKAFTALVADGPTSDAVLSDEGAATLTIEGDLMLEEIAASRTIVVVADARTDPRTDKQIVARMGNRTIVNVPIMLLDRHLGAMGTGTFGDEGVRPPTREEEEYLRALASHLAVTLDRIHLMRQARRAEEASRRLSRQLEQRVAERTAELAQVNQELEAFAYSVSHDLRAPLRHISGFVELLQKQVGASDEQARHSAQVIAAAARRMATLIDELLAFSRSARRELVVAPVNLAALVQEVFAELRGAVPERKVTLALGELPPVLADRAMIRQVLVNLVSNALKFTAPRAEAVIAIDCVAQDAQPTFRVKDNGVGFDMRYAHKLFGVFERLHSQEDFPGTGIGLAIVKRIVTRHGGRVWGEGAVGEGASLYFTLPRAEGDLEAGRR